MGKYDSLLQKKTNDEEVDFSKNKYVSLLGDKKTSFKERLTGTPTKQYDNTFKANTGVLPFLGGLPKATLDTAKSMVQGTINTGKTLGQSIAYNTLEEDTRNAIEKAGKTKEIFPNIYKTNAQALGDIGMMATEMIAPGEAGVGGVTGKLLARKTIESLVSKKVLSETEKMLAKKAVFNVLSGYGYDASSKLSEGEKDTKKILTPGFATLLSAVFTGAETKSLIKSARNNEVKNFLERASQKANFGKIPEAGTPPPGYFDKSLTALPAPRKPGEIPIELPGQGILKSAEDLRNQVKPITTPEINKKPEIQIITEAKKYKSAEDFVKNTNWKQKSEIVNNYGNDYEYHLSTEPNLVEGKTFAEQTTKGEIGMRGQSMGEGVYSTKNPQYWESQLAYEQNGQTPTNLYLVKIKNGSKSGMLESGNEAQTLNKPNEITVVKKILTNNEDKPLDIGLAESIRDKEILTDIWNEAHTTTKQQTISPLPKQEIPTPEQPIKEKIINEKIKTKPEDTTEVIKNRLPESEIPKVDSITLNDISQKSTNFINENGIEKARRIALGLDVEPFQYASQGIHAELANYARKTGDGELLAELAKSDVSKESAQKVGIGRLKEPDNPYYILKEINDSLSKGQNIMTKMTEKSTINKIVSQIKEKLPSIEFSTEQLSTIARKLICD